MKNIFENKAAKTAADIVSSVVLVFSIFVCAAVIISAKSSTGAASMFGHSMLSVQSDSMEPEFYAGDLIFIKRTDEENKFKAGDIVTFQAYDTYGKRFLNTHRIAEVVEGTLRTRYVTKGDNVGEPDEKKIFASDIIGTYSGNRLKGFGRALDFVNTSTGVLVCVVVPAALIVVWQMFSQMYNYNAGKSQREAEQYGASRRRSAYNEPDKQAIIDEYLRTQREAESKKQAIIDEYLAKQRAAEEEKAKAAAEEEKIKSIIKEFLNQQKAAQEEENASAAIPPEIPPDQTEQAPPNEDEGNT